MEVTVNWYLKLCWFHLFFRAAHNTHNFGLHASISMKMGQVPFFTNVTPIR